VIWFGTHTSTKMCDLFSWLNSREVECEEDRVFSFSNGEDEREYDFVFRDYNKNVCIK